MSGYRWLLPNAVWRATTTRELNLLNLMHMRPAAGVPNMLVHGYASTRGESMMLETPEACNFITVIIRRPLTYQYAIVEVDGGEVWLIDMLDTHTSKNHTTARPGRLLTVRSVDAAVAMAALGW